MQHKEKKASSLAGRFCAPSRENDYPNHMMTGFRSGMRRLCADAESKETPNDINRLDYLELRLNRDVEVSKQEILELGAKSSTLDTIILDKLSALIATESELQRIRGNIACNVQLSSSNGCESR